MRQTATNRNSKTKATTQTTINKIFKLQKCKMFAHCKQSLRIFIRYENVAIARIWQKIYNSSVCLSFYKY